MTDTHDDPHQQLPQTPADLAAAERAGVFSFTDPGTADADAFDLAMADDLAAFDAELLARDGADALTSDRALRLVEFQRQQAQERRRELAAAERDGDRVASALATFRSQRGWSIDALADWLGVDIEDYRRLAMQRRPSVATRECAYDRGLVAQFAERFGAHPERLLEAFDHGDL
jgi:hypothetical protein